MPTPTRLDGKWGAVEAELGGNKMPQSLISSITLTLDGASYATRVAGVADRGTLSLNTDLVPHTMDITGTEGPNKNKTILSIYKQNGDELVVCYNLAGDDYPETFVSPTNSQILLIRYKRRKPS